MNKIYCELKLNRIIDIFDDISKKPIFICGKQTVKVNGEEFILPKCEYVKISFEDYNRLHDAIKVR